ncbi:MBL fold metallo-hydrolase [archaeon]|nr:MBL fold metallo-hydrolase [archaeon]
MKITRYAQSCFLIEVKGKRVLIDPGYLNFNEYLLKHDWKDIDILLVTHKHQDHFHEEAARHILRDDKTQFFTSKEVAKAHKEFTSNIVEEGDTVNFGDFKIEVTQAFHGFLPTERGKEVHEGLGFIIDDGDKRVYHTGDTICFDNKRKANVVIAPVSGRGLVMGPYEAALFAKDCGAELLIPCHMDNPKYPVNPEVVKKTFEELKITYKILEIEENIDV